MKKAVDEYFLSIVSPTSLEPHVFSGKKGETIEWSGRHGAANLIELISSHLIMFPESAGNFAAKLPEAATTGQSWHRATLALSEKKKKNDDDETSHSNRPLD